MQSNNLNLEFFVSAGLDISKIGHATIPLKELIDLNRDVDSHMSAVVDGSHFIVAHPKTGGDFIGKINFKLRMRKPITNFLKQKQLGFNQKSLYD